MFASYILIRTGATAWPRGDTILNVNTRIAAGLAAAGAGDGTDCIGLVMIATNDFIAGDDANTISGHMDTLLATIRAACPKMRLLLIAPPAFHAPYATRVAKNAVRTSYLPLLAAKVAAGDHYVDPHTTCTDADFAAYGGIGSDVMQGEGGDDRMLARDAVDDQEAAALTLSFRPP